MSNESLNELYIEMESCNSCILRSGCSQVITAIGQKNNPALLIIGEAPNQEEDAMGISLEGRTGQVLREAIKETGILNKSNTLISNVIKCRPPKNKFPKDESPSICTSLWLFKEIEEANPKRMLLLGSNALKYVAGLKGITAHRGQWLKVRGIRTMATFHPSYVLRCDSDGKMIIRQTFEEDMLDVAEEIKQCLI